MNNRPKKQQKTCWSIVVNVLTQTNPLKLLMGVIALANLSQVAAEAQNDRTNSTYYRINRAGINSIVEPNHFQEDANECVKAAPGCLFQVGTIFLPNNVPLFSVNQYCDSRVESLKSTSLAAQIRHNKFIGKELCKGVLSSSTKLDPTETMSAHSSDYSIDLKDYDKLQVSYPRCRKG